MTILETESCLGVSTIQQFAGVVKDDPGALWPETSVNSGNPSSRWSLTGGKLVSSGLNQSQFYKALPALTTCAFGLKYTPGSVSNGTRRAVGGLQAAGGSTQSIALLELDTELTLAKVIGGPAYTTLGSTVGLGLAAATEYAIEIKATLVSGSNWTVLLRVNGVVRAEATITNLNIGGFSSITRAIVGDLSNGLSAQNANDKFRDMYVRNDDFWPGGGTWAFQVIRPNADGTYNDWVPDTGSAHFSRVNEQNVNDATYVQATNDGDTDSYEYDDTVHTAGHSVRSVKHVTRAAYLSGAKHLRHGVILGANEVRGADKALTASLGYVNTIFETKPDASPWGSFTDVDNAKFLHEQRA